MVGREIGLFALCCHEHHAEVKDELVPRDTEGPEIPLGPA